MGGKSQAYRWLRVFGTDRFVKKQQMKWTKRGAHLLLQVRTHVLDGDLRDRFCRWYPCMKTEAEPAQRAA